MAQCPTMKYVHLRIESRVGKLKACFSSSAKPSGAQQSSAQLIIPSAKGGIVFHHDLAWLMRALR
jgi:hypothetical protein